MAQNLYRWMEIRRRSRATTTRHNACSAGCQACVYDWRGSRYPRHLSADHQNVRAGRADYPLPKTFQAPPLFDRRPRTHQVNQEVDQRREGQHRRDPKAVGAHSLLEDSQLPRRGTTIMQWVSQNRRALLDGDQQVVGLPQHRVQAMSGLHNLRRLSIAQGFDCRIHSSFKRAPSVSTITPWMILLLLSYPQKGPL